MKATLKMISTLSLLTLGMSQAFAQPRFDPAADLSRPGSGGSGNLYQSGQGILPGFRPAQSESYDLSRDTILNGRNRQNPVDDGQPCPGTYGPRQAGVPCGSPAGTRPLNARTDVVCNVDFTGLEVQQYTSGSANLKKFVITGRHNAPAGEYAQTNFSVTDNDGFLTLAALHAYWQTQASRVIEINSGFPSADVPVPTITPQELRLAREAATMGIQYYNRSREVLSAQTPPRTDLPQILAAIGEKLEVLIDIERRVTSWEAAGRVPSGHIRAFISRPLERFAFNGQRELATQYRDGAQGDRPQMFCNPSAESQFIGRVMCNTDFAENTVRDTSFCGGGVTFNNRTGGGLAGINGAVLTVPGGTEPAASR